MREGGPWLRLWTGLFALGIAATVAYGFVPHPSAAERGLFDGVVALAAAASVSGWRRAPAGESGAWLCASVSVCGFLAGELAWQGFRAVGIAPLHTVAGALLVLSCLPLAAAAALLGSVHGAERDRSAWLDAAIVTAVAGLVAWKLLAEPILRDRTLAPIGKLTAIAHPFADVLVLGVVLSLLLSRNTRSRSTVSLAGGASLLLVTTLVLFGLNRAGSFRLGSPIAPVWLLGYLLVGFAALQPHEARAPRSTSRRGIGRMRLAFVALAVVTPQAVLARELVRRDLIGINTPTIAVCVAALVVALAAVRLVGLHQARLSALIGDSSDAIFLIDEDYRTLFTSPATAAIWGWSAKPQLGTSLLDSFEETHRSAIQGRLDDLRALPMGATVRLEGRICAEGGQNRTLEGLARNLLEDPDVRAIIVTVGDTTGHRELERRLERRAFHDDLTGLANRALFTDRLEHAIDRTARNLDPGIAVLFVDLDDFKAVNDGMGHAAGDELIKGVAERIRSCLRPGDTVARLGGDEFAVLLEDVPSVDQATSLADRLLEVLQLPIEVIGVSLAVPASVGVTFANRDSTAESLLRDADIAMYSAKSQGKSRVTVFDATLRDDAVQRLALKVELPEALRSAQFHLEYQPIKDVRSGELRGFEALIRWNHPERGLVSPAEFIPAAEETGIIVDIGRWVLERACHQAVLWNRTWPEPLSMSVNVSGLQLHQPRFVDDLRGILEATGLTPPLLTLELTESVLVRQQRVEGILGELRAIGVGIAIDDFGTGYSSLSYLQHFPVTSIKVDKSFVGDLGARDEVGLVRSILSIGDAFGLTTVAEGVETPEQLEALAELGCNRAQGFLLGRPQPAGEIDGLLERTRMARTARWRTSAVVSPRGA